MQKTVLITGAGFSMPYGYPSGKSLVTNIIKEYKKEHHLNLLAEQLKDSSMESIDKFINEQNKLEQKDIAKAAIEAITYQILKAEEDSLSKEAESSQDIVKFLLNKLDESDYHNITIITFNYDRYLEYRLYKMLFLRHKDNSKAMTALKKLKIIHMHGRMIPFCENDLDEYDELKIVPYGIETHCNSRNLIPEALAQFKKMCVDFAQKDFKTVDSDADERTVEAKNAIKSAQRVFFLGFGFDKKNMEKLEITPENCHHWSPYDWTNKVVAATALDIKQVQLNEIYTNYPFLAKNNLMATTVKDFFESHFDLLNSDYDRIKSNIKSCCEMHSRQEFTKPESVSRFDEIDGLQKDMDCATCGKKIRSIFEWTRGGTWQFQKTFPVT